MSSLPTDITEPGRPYVQEVSPGVYAYVEPDVACLGPGARNLLSIFAGGEGQRRSSDSERVP